MKSESYGVLKSKFDKWQSQFLSSGSSGDGQWIVPVTLCCGSYNVRKSFLLQTKTKEFMGFSIRNESGNASSNWIKMNVDQTGFYRVKYDEELAARLRHAIEKKILTETDRFGTFFTLLGPFYFLSGN